MTNFHVSRRFCNKFIEINTIQLLNILSLYVQCTNVVIITLIRHISSFFIDVYGVFKFQVFVKLLILYLRLYLYSLRYKLNIRLSHCHGVGDFIFVIFWCLNLSKYESPTFVTPLVTDNCW